jgi:hypothetical protein
LLLVGASPPAARGQGREIELGAEEFHYRTAETPLNRGNVLGLDEDEDLLRLTLGWRERLGPLRLVLRGYAERRLGEGRDDGADGQARQAYLQYAAADLATIRVGKQRLSWGSGFAWNPTDRVEPPRNPFNPTLEQEGANAVRFDLRPSSWATVTVVAAERDNTLRDLPFETPRTDRSTGVLRARFLARDTDLALVVSGGARQPTLWGLDVARGVGAGVTGHLEAAVYRGAELFPPRPGQTFFRAVTGALRTFGADHTVALEYFFNGEGYDDRQQGGYLTLLDTSAAVAFDPQAPEAERQRAMAVYLAAAFRPYAGGMGLRRHYLHASWSRGQAGGRWTLVLRALAGLDDGGFVLTPGVTFAPRDDLTVAVDAVVPGGPADSEYRLAPLRGGVQARLRYVWAGGG